MNLTHLLRLAARAALFVTAAALHATILEDRTIMAAIDNSYVFREVLTDRSMVQVYVRRSVVELRGQVADERERDLVVYTIGNITHVARVDNHLFVDSASRRAMPAWHAARIRAQILTERDCDASGTHLALRNGTFELSGDVADDAQRQHLEGRVRELAAGRPLLSHLRIESSRLRVRPIDDASIAAMVRCALEALSPAQEHARRISSQDGKVTIAGTVARAADAAEAIREAGAVRGVAGVVDQLVVLN